MHARLWGAVRVVAAVSLAVGLGACGQSGESGGSGGNASGKQLKIGLLLPGYGGATRWAQFDRPMIEAKIKELCGDCTVEYADAGLNAANQQQQAEVMIIEGADVLILASVNSQSIRSTINKARQANVPVVAYDHLAEGPISAYVGFDARRIGELQGEALLKALGDRAHDSQIVMMNGDPINPDAREFKMGALSVLEGKVKIGKAYDTPGWEIETAHGNMTDAIADLGADRIDGVYAANDWLASGVISALKAAHIKPLPPVVGQDAILSGLQRIVSGEQYMTVYKPYKRQAGAAVELALALGRGEGLDRIAKDTVSSPTTKDIPAVVLPPVAVTRHNIKETVVKDGLYTIDQICTPEVKRACDEAGLTS
ncbi:substrate-binding domain-containing protein [Streptomyces sp. PSKA54]|uniref:Substrate-binding domain-containing protein n=1 Tax=Streptomyces himalayensis subsp. aureolus TaxID=2758039 RepID=A0A7W2HGY5_9ACTN|nr:substrate-binding domain-containing protein [Streptomyces himalayensis]MBA4863477.1 substrate-binding domain-containing protein [Streptomyces himalayensis subsp. aureolus]